MSNEITNKDTKNQEKNIVPATVTEAQALDVEVEEEVKMKEIVVSDAAKKLMESLSNQTANVSDIVRTVGGDIALGVQNASAMLDRPIANLSSEEESPILSGLKKIEEQTKNISPSNFNFSPGFWGQLIDKITFSNRGSKFAAKFRTGKQVIEDIIISLDAGKLELKEDNILLYSEMQKNLARGDELTETIGMLLQVNEMIMEKANALPEGKEKQFYSATVATRLSRKILDLQQVQAVNNQSLPAFKMLIESNDELSDAVDSVKTVTVAALTNGILIAMALANQKKILNRVQTLNESTMNILDDNANLLATQSVEIAKQSGSAMLDVEKLAAQMATIDNALLEVQELRATNLPKLQNSIKILKSSADSFAETSDLLGMNKVEQIEGGK